MIYTDTDRLKFLMRIIKGLGHIEMGANDFASMIAEDRGHEEPDNDDKLDGFRMMIDEGIDIDTNDLNNVNAIGAQK